MSILVSRRQISLINQSDDPICQISIKDIESPPLKHGQKEVIIYSSAKKNENNIKIASFFGSDAVL